MGTYSINNGTTIETKTYNLIGATSIDLNPILDLFHDNENKEINPADIRDSILTIWSNISFKETSILNSNKYYIGIDSYNPNNKDIKNKIFFGKRSYLGNDIMSSNLLNNVSDIFLYNTKKDTISNNKTRISILSGTNSSLYNYAPYIQSQIIETGTSSVSLDIANPSLTDGSIDIKCISGTVSIDNINFPRIQDSIINSGDGKILSWDENNNLSWGEIEYKYEGSIGMTGSHLDIYGTPVNVNNYPIEFTENIGCPIEIGDIKVGETFTAVSIEEMLRRMIYNYLPPLCSLMVKSPLNNYVEVGTSPIIELEYMINKRTLPTLTTILSYMIPSSYPPITTSISSIVTGVTKGIVNLPITNSTATFSIIVTDGTQSNSANATINGIYPYFYGYSSLTSINHSYDLLSLIKLVENVGDKEIPIYGSGNLYFIYDDNYPELNSILDENGISIKNNFSLTYSVLSSPTGLWASKKFKIYKLNGITQIGPPSINYQFKY